MTFTKQDIVKIGFEQRRFCCIFGISILLNYFALSSACPFPINLILLIISIAIMTFQTYKFSRTFKEHIVIAIITSLLTLIPIVSLAILLIYSSRGTRIMKQAGFKVGLIGVSKKDLIAFKENGDDNIQINI